MLLKGTKLFFEKEKYQLKEKIDEQGIPYVYESRSFNQQEYIQMQNIASKLKF